VVNNPPPVASLFDDVTLDGESLLELAYQTTTEVLSVGRVGLLLDRPPLESDSPPYVALYKAEDILDWSTVREGRSRKLTKVLLREAIEDSPLSPSSFSIRYTYRLLALDSAGLYYQQVTDENGTEMPIIYPTNQRSPLTYIPFIFVNTKNLRPDVAKPPLLDIVDMNLSHYRSYASLEHGRAYTAFPQFYVAFDSNDNGMPFDPLNAPDNDDIDNPVNRDGVYRVDADAVWEVEGGKPGILEYQGSGLTSLEGALDKKEGQIQALGARLITPLKGLPAQSAVVYELQALGDAALLLQITNQVSKAMNQLMRWFLEWEQIVVSAYPSFSFVASFTDTKITARELRAILALYKEHAMPKDALYHTLREAGVLPPAMTLEDFKTLMDDPEQLWRLDDRVAV
jgi:hypothetical protein